MAEAAIDLKHELARTTAAQGDAADPTASVWVSANAGTGKTHVLTMRVLRLMLAGSAPERILCLTYTKAAAAEMSKRVFDTLARWVVLSDSELRATLTEFLQRKPTDAEVALARTLFARATETPGGLSVQTLHAFAERLLQRFPLEAGITPGFATLDEETSRTLLREAINEVIGSAARARETDLGQALSTAIAYAVEDNFDDVLGEALRFADWIETATNMPDDDATGLAGLARTRRIYESHFGVREGLQLANIRGELFSVLSDADAARARDVLQTGSKTDQKLADKLTYLLTLTDPENRVDALADFFLKADKTPRDKFLTKALDAEHPDLTPALQRAGQKFFDLHTELRGLTVVDATMALLQLAAAILEKYRDAKVRRAALDFDDLIEHAEALLRTPANAEWVLYKLDNGLDHILVDESQDTSPAQWCIVKALAGEFFATEDTTRTIFAVGDEKQSIYSFQGAAPKMFAEAGQHFARVVTAAGRTWRRIPLNLSFRTVDPVLKVVDQVFADQARVPGVGTDTAIRHIAKRFDQSGLVEVWPTEKFEDVAQSDAWAPFDEQSAKPPVLRLASHIAETIKHWTESGEILTSLNRPIQPGDILILVRKRTPFVAPMVQALKQLGIPVAGADRMELVEQIAVQDIVSLCDFLVLPEDDLALAEVLKSPIFGLDDDDLLSLAHGRKGTLWKALLNRAGDGGPVGAACDTLKRWRKQADFRPPYEFLADLYDRDGVRGKLIARLGPDAADPLDELLNLALTFDDGAPPSLSGFLASLRDGAPTIKRDMEHGRNEVRVMTVHGSKGLEAPIVFLPDTCTAPYSHKPGNPPIVVDDMPWPAAQGLPLAWPVKGTSDLAQIRDAKAAIRAAEREEYNRLLYVAMTRARDRLYVAGFERKTKSPSDCWYQLITAALDGQLEDAVDHNGGPVLRLSSAQAGPHDVPKVEMSDMLDAETLPAWAQTTAPAEPQLAVPIAPSRFAPYDMDDDGDPSPEAPTPDPVASAPSLSPRASISGDHRFQRGLLTHALLEHVPRVPEANRAKAAEQFLLNRAPTMAKRVVRSIVSETLDLISHPDFAPVFGARARAEVPVVSLIPRPNGDGPPLRIAGTIDRLVELDDRVLIVDFKTNRSAPSSVDQVAPAYLYQLAAYRLVAQQLFPEKTIEAALLWTAEPRMMLISKGVLDHSTKELWRIDPASLDGARNHS